MFAGTKVACHPYALKGNGFEGHTQCFLLPLQDVGSNAAAAHDDVLRDPLTCSSCSAAACAECSRASSRTPSGVVHTWTCPFCQNSNQLPVLMGDPFAQDDPAALFPELQKNNIEFGNSLLTLAEHQVSGRGPLVVFVVDECFSGCDLSLLADTIESSLSQFPRGSRVALISFGAHVSVYFLRSLDDGTDAVASCETFSGVTVDGFRDRLDACGKVGREAVSSISSTPLRSGFKEKLMRELHIAKDTPDFWLPVENDSVAAAMAALGNFVTDTNVAHGRRTFANALRAVSASPPEEMRGTCHAIGAALTTALHLVQSLYALCTDAAGLPATPQRNPFTYGSLSAVLEETAKKEFAELPSTSSQPPVAIPLQPSLPSAPKYPPPPVSLTPASPPSLSPSPVVPSASPTTSSEATLMLPPPPRPARSSLPATMQERPPPSALASSPSILVSPPPPPPPAPPPPPLPPPLPLQSPPVVKSSPIPQAAELGPRTSQVGTLFQQAHHARIIALLGGAPNRGPGAVTLPVYVPPDRPPLASSSTKPPSSPSVQLDGLPAPDIGEPPVIDPALPTPLEATAGVPPPIPTLSLPVAPQPNDPASQSGTVSTGSPPLRENPSLPQARKFYADLSLWARSLGAEVDILCVGFQEFGLAALRSLHEFAPGALFCRTTFDEGIGQIICNLLSDEYGHHALVEARITAPFQWQNVVGPAGMGPASVEQGGRLLRFTLGALRRSTELTFYFEPHGTSEIAHTGGSMGDQSLSDAVSMIDVTVPFVLPREPEISSPLRHKSHATGEQTEAQSPGMLSSDGGADGAASAVRSSNVAGAALTASTASQSEEGPEFSSTELTSVALEAAKSAVVTPLDEGSVIVQIVIRFVSSSSEAVKVRLLTFKTPCTSTPALFLRGLDPEVMAVGIGRAVVQRLLLEQSSSANGLIDCSALVSVQNSLDNQCRAILKSPSVRAVIDRASGIVQMNYASPLAKLLWLLFHLRRGVLLGAMRRNVDEETSKRSYYARSLRLMEPKVWRWTPKREWIDMEADQKALQPSDIVFVDTLSDIFVWIGADVPQDSAYYEHGLAQCIAQGIRMARTRLPVPPVKVLQQGKPPERFLLARLPPPPGTPYASQPMMNATRHGFRGLLSTLVGLLTYATGGAEDVAPQAPSSPHAVTTEVPPHAAGLSFTQYLYALLSS